MRERVRERERRMEGLRVWEKVDAVMASSCRQPQAPVILNRANSFAGCAQRAGGALPRGSKILGRGTILRSSQTSRSRRRAGATFRNLI